MKKPLLHCKSCNHPMFPIEILNNNITCPLCGIPTNNNKEIYNCEFNVCENCMMIFHLGCIHYYNKDYDSIYNTAFMSKFIMYNSVKNNDVLLPSEYKGLLIFDNTDKIKEFCNDVNIGKVKPVFECTCTYVYNGLAYTCPMNTDKTPIKCYYHINNI
jgi:hypothetical protein